MNAPALDALVRSALARARARRLAEALALGAAGAGVCVAAARLEGPPPAGALAAAALAGALVLAAWLRAHWPDARASARELDRAAPTPGELLTAWECERAGAGGLGGALAASVRARVDGSALLRALPRPSTAWAAPPLLAAALVALAGERGAGPAPGRVPEGGAAGGAPTAGAAAPGSAARTDDPGGDGAGARAEDRTARERAGDGGPEGGRDAERAGGDQEALADGGGERTMTGSRPPGASAEGPPAAPADPGAPSDRSAGTPARWWPADYDPIVAGWLERRRAPR